MKQSEFSLLTTSNLFQAHPGKLQNVSQLNNVQFILVTSQEAAVRQRGGGGSAAFRPGDIRADS